VTERRIRKQPNILCERRSIETFNTYGITIAPVSKLRRYITNTPKTMVHEDGS
jgi:hypothetical protein